ncbi:hypothetical protein RB653_006412 [Dictyostelium firmibasis]|uniref:Transmembrane protein n=1 Tax=Dictyostelium firmibasis TaxID=79012 RepID=A0AAN7Z586_9MYCE
MNYSHTDIENQNGAELKQIKRVEESRNQYILRENIDYSHDCPYSIAFVILGVFFWLPFLFNIVYIRSPNTHARRIAIASVILASIYFSALFVGLVILGTTVAYYQDSNWML